MSKEMDTTREEGNVLSSSCRCGKGRDFNLGDQGDDWFSNTKNGRWD